MERREPRPASADGECPSSEDLAAFAGGRPNARVAEHVATCDGCARIVSIVGSSTAGEVAPPTAPAENRPKLGPGDTVGRYVIVRRLGRGGMGTVGLGYDPVLDRTVALKLIRTELASPELSARMEREARSLAQIAHPNVVRVFDAGAWHGQVFLAMEHVEGHDLRHWLALEPRTIDSIVRIFVDVARGLAATHEAGFVHRDVKPDNILVDSSGVARLADFGLVGQRGDSEPADTGALDETSSGAPASARVGTPAYMAPEQRRGQVVGPAADQFSLCVSLWEALSGSSAPVGSAGAACNTTSREVPGWLRDIIDRGLRPDPRERWPSMASLIAALEDDPIAKRRRRIGTAGLAAAVLLLAAVVVFGVSRRGELPRTYCQGMGDKLAGVWDSARAATLRAELSASGRPYDRAIAARVTRELDDYARRWVRTRTDACRATRVRGEQSEALLDRRMTCLDRRLGELDALVGVLSAPGNTQAVNKAVEAAATLPDPATCDAISLARTTGPFPRLTPRVQAAYRVLARARALERTGKYRAALAALQSVAAEAESIGFPPLLAELLSRQASAQDKAGEPKRAAATLHRGLLVAADANDDALAARLWAKLIHVTARGLARPGQALEMRWAARASVRRAGRAAELDANVWTSLAIAHYAKGDLRQARAHQQRALALFERAHGREHLSVARALTSLGIIAYAQADYAEALRYLARARRIFEQTLGPEHPHVAAVLSNQGIVAYASGDYARAARCHERALAIWRRALGDDHPNIAAALTNLGLVELARGQYDRALRHHERALAIRTARLGADHPDVAVSLNNLGCVYFARGQLKQARRYHERALAIRTARLGASHADVAVSLNNLGDVLLAQGRYDRARRHYARALSVWRKALGSDHPATANALTGLARARLHMGRADDARSAARRAVALREKAKVPPAELARSRFVLARALWALGAHTRALALARRAAHGLHNAGAATRHEAAQLGAWLRQHGEDR